MAIHVFYANRYHSSYPTVKDYRQFCITCTKEIYNGGIIFYQPDELRYGQWALMDGTPPHEDRITEEMKAYLLLLGAF